MQDIPHIWPVFRGRVTPDAKLVLFESESGKRRKWLESLAGSGDVEIIVRRPLRQRSLDVNAYLHAVVFPMVAAHTGEDITETKRLVMGECWGYMPDPESPGVMVPVKGHTSAMSSVEASYFIEWVGPWAFHQFGLEIPLPENVEW